MREEAEEKFDALAGDTTGVSKNEVLAYGLQLEDFIATEWAV